MAFQAMDQLSVSGGDGDDVFPPTIVPALTLFHVNAETAGDADVFRVTGENGRKLTDYFISR